MKIIIIFKELMIEELFVFVANFNFTYILKCTILDNIMETIFYEENGNMNNTFQGKWDVFKWTK